MVVKAILGVEKVLVCTETFFRGQSDNDVDQFKVHINKSHIFIHYYFKQNYNISRVFLRILFPCTGARVFLLNFHYRTLRLFNSHHFCYTLSVISYKLQLHTGMSYQVLRKCTKPLWNIMNLCANVGRTLRQLRRLRLYFDV